MCGVCVCVREREREKEGCEPTLITFVIKSFIILSLVWTKWFANLFYDGICLGTKGFLFVPPFDATASQRIDVRKPMVVKKNETHNE